MTGLCHADKLGCFVKPTSCSVTKHCCVTVSTGQAEFPSMTICPHYNSAYRRELLRDHQLDVEDLRRGLKFPKFNTSSTSTTTMTSLSSAFHRVTFEWHELVDRIAIKSGAKLANTNYTIFVFARRNDTSVDRGSTAAVART